MKFLCDNCKAKYQISDDKVAGKTVRMKCRKCGHQIEVRAAVTETSVSMAPPGAPAATGAVAAPAAPQAPKKPGLATSLSTASPPRPMTQKMSRPEGSALAGAFSKAVHDEPAPKSVGRPPASQPPSALDMLDVSMTEEWYVAINGVPVGPVRVSELRRKAGGGAVTEDSLCWQEGLEEWRPIKSIPELARIVREAASSGRPSLTNANAERVSNNPPPAAMAPHAPTPTPAPHGQAPRPPTAPAMAPRPPQATPAPRPVGPAPSAPMQAAASATGRNNVVPIAGRLATAEKIDEMALMSAPPPPTPAPIASDPFASSQGVNAVPIPPPQFSVPAPLPVLAPPPTGFGNATTSPSSLIAVPQKKGVPIFAIAAIAFAGCFGIAVAILVFMPKQPAAPPNVVIQMPPTAATVASTAAPTDSAPAASASAVASADPAGSASAGKLAMNGAPKQSSGGTTAASAPKTGADLKGLLGDGPGGPGVGPGGPGGGAGGGGLDSNAVQTVVRNRAPAVRRKCWDSGGADQKSSVNVSVAVTVAPNGSVQNATATGDDPTIGHCIEREVKSWSFPAPGSTTTVNIPFHFVRQ